MSRLNERFILRGIKWRAIRKIVQDCMESTSLIDIASLPAGFTARKELETLAVDEFFFRRIKREIASGTGGTV